MSVSTYYEWNPAYAFESPGQSRGVALRIEFKTRFDRESLPSLEDAVDPTSRQSRSFERRVRLSLKPKDCMPDLHGTPPQGNKGQWAMSSYI